jgi:hypothetical protein
LSAFSDWARIAQVFLGWVFLAAALSKVRNLVALTDALQAAVAVKASSAHAAAVLIVAVEAVLGTTMLAALLPNVATVLSCVLLAAFTSALIRLRQLGFKADCGCFGDRSGRSAIRPIARNAILLTVAIPMTAITLGGGMNSPTGHSSGLLVLAGTVFFAAVAAMYALLDALSAYGAPARIRMELGESDPGR